MAWHVMERHNMSWNGKARKGKTMQDKEIQGMA
jgi:hypothetical protein